MLKLYNYLQSRIQSTELKLSQKLEARLAELYAARLFYFGLIVLNVQLVIWQIIIDVVKFLIILFSDPGDSFNLFFRQRELRSCPYSYHTYRQIQAKIRIFSTAGVVTLITVAVLSSLITNLIFGPRKPTYAATFGWIQTSFLGGATTTPATHPGNQSGWSWFFSKDSGVNITASGTVQLGQITGSTTQTTDADFNQGTNSSTTVANNSVFLAKDLHVNEYTVGHLANVNVTITAVGSSSPFLLNLSGTPNLARIFKNDKFTDSAGKAWKVLSLNPSATTPRLLVIDSEDNGGTPAVGAGTVGRWYANLSNWEAAREGNLVTRNATERALPYYDVSAETSLLDISGWTTDANHRIEIVVPPSERHRGKWDSGRYRMEYTVSAISHIIQIQESDVYIDGLQIKITTSAATVGSAIKVLDTGNFTNIKLSNLVIEGVQTGNPEMYAIWSYSPISVSNSVMYGFDGSNVSNSTIRVADNDFTTSYFNNLTIANCTRGINSTWNGTWKAQNVLTQNCTDGFMNGSVGSNYNASSVAGDAPGANSRNGVTASFVDSTNKDFHLQFNDTAAKNFGIDLSADANLPITTDIDSDTRSGTWDIGADDVGATFVHTSSIGTASRDFATLQAWEDARDGVLTTRNIFKIAAQSGAFTAGETITGGTSGATGIYIQERATPSASETYMSLDSVTGTFVAGETLTGGTSTQTATLSSIITTAGTIEKGEMYNDSVFTAGISINGSTADAGHYLWLTAEPRSRHWGVAGTGARVEKSTAGDLIYNGNSGTKIENLELAATGGVSQDGIQTDSGTNVTIAGNLVYKTVAGGATNNGITIYHSASSPLVNNNIVYGFATNGIIDISTNGASIKTYNNAIYNSGTGVSAHISATLMEARNNISIGSSTGFSGAFSPVSSNNISFDSTAPGTNSLTSKTLSDIKFVSTDSSLIDLHIMPGSVARNIGADLSATFKTDLDGQTRPTGANTWDIGVDEWQVSSPIYKTSGIFESGTIDLGVKGYLINTAPTVAIPRGTGAGFSVASSDNPAGPWNYSSVDEPIIPTNADVGLVRQDCTGYSNCYTSLAAWVNAKGGINFGSCTSGDLVCANKIAVAKIDGPWTVPDVSVLNFTGWIAGQDNYVKIYTTPEARHFGKWDANKYILQLGNAVYFPNYTKVAGIQLSANAPANRIRNLYYGELSHSLLKNTGTAGDNIIYYDSGGKKTLLWNNVFIKGSFYTGGESNSIWAYNNTFYEGSLAQFSSGRILAKNNIVQGMADGYIGTFVAGSDYNISDVAGDAPGANSKNGVVVNFMDAANGDLRLAQGETNAIDSGVNLSSDPNIVFSSDVIGNSRRGTWDIGAHEYGASTAINGRYIRYRTAFTSNAENTSILSDLTFNYTSFPASSSLISSPFNSGDAANILAKLEWVESLASSTDVTFQLRTSPDGAAWTSWLGPDGTSGTDYTDPAGSEAIPAILGNGTDDQYLQYRLTLHSDGQYTPTLSSVNVTYVVNGAPEITIATSTPIMQSASGTIAIDYSVRDIDTLTGRTPGTVLIGLDYCTANCSATGTEVWTSASPASLSGQAATTTVEEANWNSYALVWNPNIDFENQVLATSSFKIRLTANDSEAANNIGYAVSDNFNLDTRNPAIISFIVNGTASSSNVYITATDDHNLLMELSPNADFSGATPVAYLATSTYNLSAQPVALYLRLTDSYGNVSTSSLTLPEAPTAMMIQDNSNLYSDPNEYRLFIAWKVPAEPVAGFDHYHIDRSEDNVTWLELTQTSNRSINYYGDSTTVQDQLYYYRVSVMDQDGNLSYLSETVSGKANGTQDAGEGGGGIGAAGVPPVISNIAPTSTYSTQVAIEWETDALSDSLVYYVTASGTDFSTAPSTGVATLRNTIADYGKHAVTLTGLVPSTTYYYIVKSTAINGAAATSSERQVTTSPGPVIADDVQMTGITNSQAYITWTTDLDSSSYVLYSTSSELLSPIEVGTIDLARSHGVTLTGLAPGTRYYFAVKSDTARRDHADGQLGYFSFETTQDTEPPVISNVRCGHTADTTLAILWDTNEPATGLAVFGTQTNTYSSTTVENPNLNLDHQFDLSSLLASTTYYFKVNSRDQNGYSATSTEYSCSTAAPIRTEAEIQLMIEQAKQTAKAEGRAEQQASGGGGGVMIIDKTDKTAPVISEVQAVDIKSESARVVWVTDEEADSFVSYGTGTTTGSFGSWKLEVGHSATLSNLAPQSVYSYKVASRDASGNLGVSNDFSFTTPTLEEQLKAEGKTAEEIKKLEEQAQKKEEDKGKIILEAARRAMDLVAQVANQVSLGTLEQALTGQFDTIEKLATVIPAPILGGEPTVITTPTTATISWTTDREANSMVALATEAVYKLLKLSNNPYDRLDGNPDTRSKYHEVKVTGLKPETTYHFQLRSRAAVGPMAKSRDFSFKTSTEALEILTNAVEKVTPSSATFKWLTNQETDTKLVYVPYHQGKLAVEMAKTIMEKPMTTVHEVRVDDFEGGTVYQVELSGLDAKKNRVSKVIETFSTSKDDLPPEISGVQTESALSQGKQLKVQSIISWTTNEPTIGQVEYIKGVVTDGQEFPDKTVAETTYGKKHVAVVTKFDSGQVYTFRVTVADSSGNKTSSKIYTVLTPKQKESVFQLILKNFEDIFGWVGKLGN